MLQTRRRLLQTIVMGPAFHALHAARQEFWESKDPATWSSEEKQIVLAQSPWARQGAVVFETERNKPRPAGSYGVARPGGDMPGSRPNQIPVTSVPIGEKPPPVPRTDTGPPIQFGVLARWESAKPVRLAGGPELPPETGGFYVIRLRGMPLLPIPKSTDGAPVANPNQSMLEAIKQGSRIERKDKAGIACAHLLTGTGETANELLLFFPRGADPISPAEKMVTLVSHFSPFQLSIRFPLKDMLFKGELAL